PAESSAEKGTGDRDRRVRSMLRWAVIVWGMGVLVLSACQVAGWVRVQQWRRRASRLVDATWTDMVVSLRMKMGVKASVDLLETKMLKTAAVVGVLRPAILLPMSVMAELSAAQVEAILAHELAHVRRHDYLVNLI